MQGTRVFAGLALAGVALALTAISATPNEGTPTVVACAVGLVAVGVGLGRHFRHDPITVPLSLYLDDVRKAVQLGRDLERESQRRALEVVPATDDPPS